MIKGIGIDIVDKERMQHVLQRQGQKFINRILTETEQKGMPSTGDRQLEYVAGRFAAKEAFAKATGFGFGKELSWQDVAVLRDDRGKPTLELCRKWLEIHNPKLKQSYHVSISHEKKYAVAQVIIEE
ncbi:holo-ACP synthase [Ammoniphilus sp. CFH 90114]|uniref:holo-ACP synthase n=1 Tax=Ammoniphilus sp. CFH 90114 TaxID=2493665 RepID=UPI00100DAE7B|nr:holo-ACP synthase [Ammoniphilus sp. CFH 90114]RXT05204.1 holo-ACP synthase [Ammoniphilus sp. CFH 90114]